MSHIFEIDKSFVKAVDDEAARELVARLCRAELRAQGLPESAVTWGGDQRAKDGGVDVRVDCPNPLRKPDFIKTARSVIQVKAENFPPSKIQEEMAPKGTLRPAILDLKETAGSYVIVSTQDDFTDSALQPRRDAIRKCLNDYGLDSFVQSDFYDSRRIADWVEQYPSIATWLRQKIGQPIKGWRPYGPWAYKEEDPKAEYLIDEQAKIFVPGAQEGTCVTDAISQLRSELRSPVSIRIVGLSGVGKTRLVQALFDSRVCPESPTPALENVIYVDLADEPEPQPQEMLESLLQHGTDSIVVVDNCGPDAHERLTQIVKRKDSLLKLISIEYDIGDNLPEDTLCYRLEGSSSEVIKSLLKGRFQCLSDNDSDQICEFSDGNARVAFALASTVETGGELSQLRNQELFKRLFQQKNDPNDELLRIAEAASLLYSFNGSDLSPNSEIAKLADIAEVSPLSFSRHMAELERRGLIQRRGQWRAVLPHAIANGLAVRMLQSMPAEDLLCQTLIEQGDERIARSFCRRLGFLHDCQEAVTISSRLFAIDGRFGNLASLTDFEQQMFVNLAPLNPRTVLDVIQHAIETDSFLSPDTCDPSQIIQVIRSVAYEPEHFFNAASILKDIALKELNSYGQKLAREVLISLFYCHLSGTQASPKQRHEWVKSLFFSDNKEEHELAFELIEAGLTTSHFSSHYGFEFGARQRNYGWHPRSHADVVEWFRPWIQILTSIGEENNENGQKARTIFGKSWRCLWNHVGLNDELVDAARRLKAIDGWPEGWLAVHRVLQFDLKTQSPTSLAQLKEVEKLLAPSNLISEIRACILSQNALIYDLDYDELDGDRECEQLSASEKRQKMQVHAEEVGERAASFPELIETLIPDLCSEKYSSGSYAFGLGIGKHHTEMTGLLKSIRECIRDNSSGNLNLIWVRGLIVGWKNQESHALEMFLDQAVEDSVWIAWFVELQLQMKLDSKSVDRLIRALDFKQCPSWQFSYLSMGRATDPMTVSQIMEIVNKLALRPDRGIFIAIDLLAMVILCTDKKDEQYKSELSNSLLEFIGSLDWYRLELYRGDIDHDLGIILNFTLKSVESEDQIIPILKHMLPMDETDRIRSGDIRIKVMKLFFKYFPRLSLDILCVSDENKKFKIPSYRITNTYFDQDDVPFSDIPKEILIEWCNGDPDARYSYAANACQLFERQDKDKGSLKITDIAIAILTAAPDKMTVVGIFMKRFHPTSWGGSLVNILENRLPLFDQLDICGDQAVNHAITFNKEKYLETIEAERAREREEERSKNSSFE